MLWSTVGKGPERPENSVDDRFRRLVAAAAEQSFKRLLAPLFAGGVEGLDHSICVGDQQVPRFGHAACLHIVRIGTNSQHDAPAVKV